MDNDVKVICLTESQCKCLMDFIKNRFVSEVDKLARPMEWAWNMADVYKKLEEAIKND